MSSFWVVTVQGGWRDLGGQGWSSLDEGDDLLMDEDDVDQSWSGFHACRPRLHALARIFSIALHSKIHDLSGQLCSSLHHTSLFAQFFKGKCKSGRFHRRSSGNGATWIRFTSLWPIKGQSQPSQINFELIISTQNKLAKLSLKLDFHFS